MLFHRTARHGFALARFCRSPGRMVPPHLTDHAAAALTRLIADHRADSIARGVRPIPATVSRALLGFFPEALLRKTRLAVGEPTTLRLPTLRISYGDAGFVTLGDVVRFNETHAAHADLAAWAHALTHIVQHERSGAEGFARLLVLDRDTLEREATQNAARFMTWNRQQRAVARL